MLDLSLLILVGAVVYFFIRMGRSAYWVWNGRCGECGSSDQSDNEGYAKCIPCSRKRQKRRTA